MTRRKDGLWQQQMTVMENGRKKQKCFYGKTKAEVLRKIAEYKEKAETGLIFSEVAEKWWDQHINTISASTASRCYLPALKRAIDYFGKTPIRAIRTININQFLTSFLEDHPVAQKTVKNQLSTICMIFKYAITNGYVETNVARDVIVPRHLPKKKREPASSDDISKIKKYIDLPFGLMPYMALYTGCRRGELLALNWEDIFLENRFIRINKSIGYENGKPYLKEPKTEAGERYVPILDKLYPVLESRKSTGLIFNRNGQYLKNYECTKLYDKYKAQAGISCTLHQLRHAFATMLFENDISPKDAQEILGHANIQVTNDIYTHIRKERREKIRDDLLGADIM